SGKMTKFMFLRKKVFSFQFLGRERIVIVSNVVASIIFFFTGVLILYLKSIGRLGKEDTEGFTTMITGTSGYVNQYVGGNIALNLLFVILLIFVLYKIAKRI
ncbi:MAG: hypothetical protein Q8Q49_01450, partial [bacterium]|nr:hypothetical protein [bacterium]